MQTIQHSKLIALTIKLYLCAIVFLSIIAPRRMCPVPSCNQRYGRTEVLWWLRQMIRNAMVLLIKSDCSSHDEVTFRDTDILWWELNEYMVYRLSMSKQTRSDLKRFYTGGNVSSVPDMNSFRFFGVDAAQQGSTLPHKHWNLKTESK